MIIHKLGTTKGETNIPPWDVNVIMGTSNNEINIVHRNYKFGIGMQHYTYIHYKKIWPVFHEKQNGNISRNISRLFTMLTCLGTTPVRVLYSECVQC